MRRDRGVNQIDIEKKGISHEMRRNQRRMSNIKIKNRITHTQQNVIRLYVYLYTYKHQTK